MKKIELTTERDFNAMADVIYKTATADHTRVSFSDSANMTTRFANNQVIQNVAIRRPRLTVQVAFGKQVGRMSTDKFDTASLKAAVVKAEQIAKLCPQDPEYMEPLPPQEYAKFKTYSKTTAGQDPDDLADEVKGVVERCDKNGCNGAGIVTANRSHSGVSTDKGLRAFEARTRSSFSLTATLPDSTGWTMNSHRKISKLNIKERAGTAINKAKTSANPTEIPAGQDPDDLADEVKGVVERCDKNGCNGAGIVTANRSHSGVSTDKGLRAFEARTRSSFSLTATLPDSTGWTMNSHRKISKLNIKERAGTAINKAKTSANPTEIPAGHYEVILEPAAVAGLVGPMIWMLSAKNYHKGNSPYVGKLNQQILDERLQIESHPQNELLLGSSFDGQGMPYRKQTWVKDGVLRRLYYDRFTAKEHNEHPDHRPIRPRYRPGTMR